MTLLFALPGIAHAQQESEPETLLTLQEMQKIIKEFREMQPGLQRLIERESELSALLGELEKIAEVDFNDTTLLAENSTASDFSPTDSTISDQAISSPGAQAENVSSPSQDSTMSAAERFRMMQMGTQPEPKPATGADSPGLANANTDSSTDEIANSNLTAAERFRMMQTTVPTITRAEETQNSPNVDNSANSEEITEQEVPAAEFAETLPDEDNSAQGTLTAAERFRLMASGQETLPATDNKTTDDTAAETNQTDEIAIDTAQTASGTNEFMSAAERFRQMQSAFIENDNNPEPSSEIARTSDDVENPVISRPSFEAGPSPHEKQLAVTGSRPLEDNLLPQLPGEKPVVSNQIRGSRQIDPNLSRVKSPIFARVQNDAYYLHLFSYKDWGASKITSNWQKKRKNLPKSISSLKIAVKEQITRSGKYNRMYLGPVLSRAEAQQHCIELQQLNYYCKVTNNI